MKNTWQVIFSGVGGQGLMLAGNLLGETATAKEGKNASMSSAYGVETRGTFAKSDVVVSTEEIDFPEVLQPDAIIALAPVAYERYAKTATADTVLIYDSIIDTLPSKAQQKAYPISQIAKEAGNSGGLNMVALGVLVALTGIVSPNSVEETIQEAFAQKERFLELNLKAFRAGMAIVVSPTVEN